MEKLDFRKAERALYAGKVGRWDRIVVPKMRFVTIAGQGAPAGEAWQAALGALYPVAYAVKFAMKAAGADFVVPPLEGTWHAEDPGAFLAGRREEWRWTAMLRVPDAVSGEVFAAAVAKSAGKADAAVLASVELSDIEEGDSLQTLHIGPYAAETPVLADLHGRVMPEAGVTFGLPHHEIYLSDARRVAPEKLKTILRQPVRPI